MPTHPRSKPPTLGDPGPFRAYQLPPKTDYELSNGHPIRVAPTGNRGSEAQTWGAAVIATDPAVARAGTDTGYTPDEGTLRAPDVSVIPVATGKGWVHAVPPLAIEYADVGQDEEKLAEKITDLLRAGTRHLWVVRLGLNQRVEVHEPGRTTRVAEPGEALDAPGILSRPVTVESLFDPAVALPVVADNALRKMGLGGIEGLRQEGKAEGKAEARAQAAASIRDLFRQQAAARSLPLTAAAEARLDQEDDPTVLTGWVSDLLSGRRPLD